MARDAIPPGTLHLLILKTLDLGKEMHGFEIADAIERVSGEVLTVEEGSLYPALQRMLLKGWVTGTWDTTEGNRRARYYKLTRKGRQRLAAETRKWETMVRVISRVLKPGEAK